MSNINFLKPDKSNLNTFLYLGSFLFFVSILDVFLNSFFKVNLTGFLPNLLSFLLPLILGFIGLYFVRIEFSGIKHLDLINKHINTNNFNAILSLLIIFVVIKSIPPTSFMLSYLLPLYGRTMKLKGDFIKNLYYIQSILGRCG